MKLTKKLIITGTLFLLPTNIPEKYSKELYNNISSYEKKDIQEKDIQEKEILLNTASYLAESSPLKMRGVKRNFGEILGYSQAEEIIKTYNKRKDIKSIDSYEKQKNISFPLIYPEIKKYFPDTIELLLQQETFKKYENIITENMVIISRCENNKTALGYYKNGELKLATHISIGINKRTIQGIFPLTCANKYKRSSRYNNTAMPYAIHIQGHYFIHQGKSDGTDKSHGCVRVPGLYQEYLYQDIAKNKKNTTKIILDGIYTPTLFSKHTQDK